MSTLLHIDSSPMGNASISRRLTGEFVKSWKTANPNGQVVYRDLYAGTIPPVTGEWVAAAYTPPSALSAEQKQLLALSDQICDEIARADEWVLGVPMHNFTIPSVLSLWIGQIARVGKTFTYENGVPTGMLKGKKVHIIVTSGGAYEPGSPTSSMDFVVPYLKALFGFIGLTDIEAHYAGSTSSVRNGKVDIDTFLKPHVQTVQQVAAGGQLVR